MYVSSENVTVATFISTLVTGLRRMEVGEELFAKLL